jgi:ferric-dicitrate binding protein FerR (iron transport regulator)
MTESMPPDLLARYLSGDASPEERDQVERWAAEAPAHRAELDRLRAAWVRPRTGGWDIDRAWSRVQPQLAEPTRARPVSVPVAMAASLLMVFAAGMVWQALTTRDSRDSTGELPNVYATGPGQRLIIQLADGSELMLAPNSDVSIPSSYGNDERRVDLNGEAWFEVHHDVARPFRVYGGGAITQDLGTEFSVRTLPGQGVRVVLVSGSASLRRDGAAEAVVLQPSQVAVLEPGAGTARIERDVPVESLVSWRSGTVSFRDAPVDSVLAELARWYARRFALDDPADSARRFTGPLRIDDLDEALEVLTLSLGMTADRRRDGGIVLR